MTEEKIKRINELSRKSRETGLSDDEKKEQQQLRDEYRAGFKRNLMEKLDNVYILDENGKERKITEK